MHQTLDILSGLSPGERVRLTFDSDDPIEFRVCQKHYDLQEHLRLELTRDSSGRDGRYRLEAYLDDAGWTRPEIRRYDPVEDGWVTLDTPTDVTPLGAYNTVKSADMVAQEGPEHASRQTIGDVHDA